MSSSTAVSSPKFSLRSRLSVPRPSQLWLALFAIWLVSLSGWVGVPGFYQSMRLQGLLKSKQNQISQLEGELKVLQREIQQQDKNKFTQQREIRRVLGYSAPDEIIFDFTQESSF